MICIIFFQRLMIFGAVETQRVWYNLMFKENQGLKVLYFHRPYLILTLLTLLD